MTNDKFSKSLMQACEKFLIEEECFYSCEPRLIKWQLVNTSLKGVPICGDYCNDWYEACKDDETCTHDWLVGFNYTNDMYICPRNSKCQKFKEVCTFHNTISPPCSIFSIKHKI